MTPSLASKEHDGTVETIFRRVSLATADSHTILLGLFMVTLAIKVIVFLFATDPIIFCKYPYFAQKIAQGFDIGERLADLSPAYLAIHVIFYRVFGTNGDILAFLQIMIGSLNVLVIYAICEHLFGRTIGIMAAVILALYGNMTLIEGTLEPEVFVIFFSSLAVLALIRAKNTPDRKHADGINTEGQANSHERPADSALSNGMTPGIARWRAFWVWFPWKWFAAGLLLGLSVITKPNVLLLLPGALIWIWWDKTTVRQRMQVTLWLLVGAVLLVSPVTLRNYVKLHDFILITADGGKVFFHGNGPGATGMDRADLPNQGFIEEGQSEPDYAHALFRMTARSSSAKPLKPSECSTYWVRYTLNDMAAHPGRSLLLLLKKACLFLNNYEVHDIDASYKSYRTIQSWPLLPFGLIVTLGIVGMAAAVRRFREIFLLYWIVLIYLVSVMVFFAASRYRLPAAPFLSIFAAFATYTLYGYLRARHWKKGALVLAAVFVVALGTTLPFRNDIERFDRWQQASRIHYSLGGTMFFKKGEYREAIREFRKSIAIDPGFAPAYNYLGKSYAILNHYKEAEAAFQKVIQLAPTIDEGYMNMGLLSELQGNRSQAEIWFQKALERNPRNEKTKSHLEALRTPSRHRP